MNAQNTIYHVRAQKHSFQNNSGFIHGHIEGQCFTDIQEHKGPILYIYLCLAMAQSSVYSINKYKKIMEVRSHLNKWWLWWCVSFVPLSFSSKRPLTNKMYRIRVLHCFLPYNTSGNKIYCILLQDTPVKLLLSLPLTLLHCTNCQHTLWRSE